MIRPALPLLWGEGIERELRLRALLLPSRKLVADAFFGDRAFLPERARAMRNLFLSSPSLANEDEGGLRRLGLSTLPFRMIKEDQKYSGVRGGEKIGNNLTRGVMGIGRDASRQDDLCCCDDQGINSNEKKSAHDADAPCIGNAAKMQV
ncbi:hypothetical protein [Acidovorax sp. M2(2025)]|uniref:hypothetical protein n=1 Tax=Acidovorax sp. M2(2025) TaxID=3411355 RepID=UPI003BF462A6